jgi:hypothetical protein
MEIAEEHNNNDIQDAVEIRERLLNKIAKYEEEIDYMKRNISILDSILKGSSFAKASALKTDDHGESKPASSHTSTQSSPPQPQQQSPPNNPNITQIRKSGEPNGEVIADAHVTPDKISIIINDKITLDVNTPPFRTFFIDRIIGEMKKKDIEEEKNGKLQKESIINYTINQDGSRIKEIIIKNYRRQDRLKELTSTASWSFTHMLKNAKK